ncbi:MAG: 5-amino-6-(D-ribitylamino)uracil--L-tyrosine 4-hydroxyphenyl transferase CofH [Alphaproteobacteria bacterium]|nr:5-amino-6-(D-ribitylamino)uracil--L-tyrosine 4-hydroxyphenyl transferase CofH [Alphaproteobacteria bacterium]
MSSWQNILEVAGRGRPLSVTEALSLEAAPLEALMEVAEVLTREGFGRALTYSRKVFIPLTQLCRDVCHYCTFAKAPRTLAQAYLSVDEAVAIARAGAKAGCKEALFTLGDKPELRYAAAREALETMGFASTLDYLGHVARRVEEETGLLPHLNPGAMSREEIARLRPFSVSMGLMLETAADRLCMKGGPHYGSPDKAPSVRMATLRAAGEAKVPFTTGLLVGIGETRSERIEALLALREIQDRYGHIQELIIQNFRPKPGTRMANAPEPALEEHLWTIAVARLIFGSAMSIQAPPNLQGDLAALIRAGVNDWGGVSPVTPDHVNPEAPWPHLDLLAQKTAAAGRVLVERLAIGPAQTRAAERWLDPGQLRAVVHKTDARGLVRPCNWTAGAGQPVPAYAQDWLKPAKASPEIAEVMARVTDGEDLSEDEIVALFSVDGPDLGALIGAADALRKKVVGDTVSYVVNRNINYTNICTYKCGFCAFSKAGGSRDARGPAYRLDLEEIGARTQEAWARGASEVCLQGGIHPDYTGKTYLDIVRAVKQAVPAMHVHAFSPLEINHGAQTLELPLEAYLAMLHEAGLSSLPGTAAEILDDEVRAIICPDKINTQEWFAVMRAAHRVGIKSTATIMFGHVDQPWHWARHLLRLREHQKRFGGFTEFVPLPFVHMEAPMWRKRAIRPGPTFREAVLMHAVARLVLHPHIANIQTSWVKMGAEGAAFCLQAGANDLGGVLMDESITRAAGGLNGQYLDSAQMHAVASALRRPCRQRTTLYREPPPRRNSVQFSTT